jgi:OLD-like protein
MTARLPDAAPRAVVVVEGESDAAAVRAAARVLGRDLLAEGVEVVSLGGVTGVRRYLAGTTLDGARVAGLCDERESADFARALDVLGDHAVFVCRADLEDELIRAVGMGAIERLLAAQGDLTAFRTLQGQPAHLGSAAERQLHRFLGAGSGRKIRYGRLLVEALEPEALPEPLRLLLQWV